MTQEEKQLLLKDLCARQLFGIKICYTEFEYGCKSTWDVDFVHPCGKIICKNPYGIHDIENCQLYLRPMSSMTKEELIEYKHLVAFSGNPEGSANFVDWLNKKMFAYRTIDDKDMFELGLALVAPEGMYNV